MRLSEGVEWGVHTCVVLAWLDDRAPIPSQHLAAAHELPAAYLTKQLQAMARAGIVTSTTGPRGGFRLARPPEEIAVLDVVDAIEGGRAELFHCTEIRRCGIGGDVPASCFKAPCSVAATMHDAEEAWRASLAGTTVADLAGSIEAAAPGSTEHAQNWFTNR